MRLRRNHINTIEGHLHGLFYLVVFGIPFAMAALALYRTFDEPLGDAPLVDEHPRMVQELSNPTPLPTALQMCNAPKDEPGIATAELWRYVDGHYELHVWENREKINEVGYVLTFQPSTLSGTPGPVAIDISIPGQLPMPLAEPTMSQALRDCLKAYKAIDKGPGR